MYGGDTHTQARLRRYFECEEALFDELRAYDDGPVVEVALEGVTIRRKKNKEGEYIEDSEKEKPVVLIATKFAIYLFKLPTFRLYRRWPFPHAEVTASGNEVTVKLLDTCDPSNDPFKEDGPDAKIFSIFVDDDEFATKADGRLQTLIQEAERRAKIASEGAGGEGEKKAGDGKSGGGAAAKVAKPAEVADEEEEEKEAAAKDEEAAKAASVPRARARVSMKDGTLIAADGKSIGALSGVGGSDGAGGAGGGGPVGGGSFGTIHITPDRMVELSALIDGEFHDFRLLKEAYINQSQDHLLAELSTFIEDNEQTIVRLCREYYDKFLAAADQTATVEAEDLGTMSVTLEQATGVVASVAQELKTAGTDVMECQRTLEALIETSETLQSAQRMAHLWERVETQLSSRDLLCACFSLSDLQVSCASLAHQPLGEYLLKVRIPAIRTEIVERAKESVNRWMGELRLLQSKLGNHILKLGRFGGGGVMGAKLPTGGGGGALPAGGVKGAVSAMASTAVATLGVGSAAPPATKENNVPRSRKREIVEVNTNGDWMVRDLVVPVTLEDITASYNLIAQQEGDRPPTTDPSAPTPGTAAGGTSIMGRAAGMAGAAASGVASGFGRLGGGAREASPPVPATPAAPPTAEIIGSTTPAATFTITQMQTKVFEGASLQDVFCLCGLASDFHRYFHESRSRQLQRELSVVPSMVNDVATFTQVCETLVGFFAVEHLLHYAPSYYHLRAPLDLLISWDAIAMKMADLAGALRMKIPPESSLEVVQVIVTSVAGAQQIVGGTFTLNVEPIRAVIFQLRDMIHSVALQKLQGDLLQVTALDTLQPLEILSPEQYQRDVVMCGLQRCPESLLVVPPYRSGMIRVPYTALVPAVCHAVLAFVEECYQVVTLAEEMGIPDDAADAQIAEYITVALRTVSAMAASKLQVSTMSGGGGGGMSTQAAALLGASMTALTVVTTIIEQRYTLYWRGRIMTKQIVGEPQILANAAKEFRIVSGQATVVCATKFAEDIDLFCELGKDPRYWGKLADSPQLVLVPLSGTTGIVGTKVGGGGGGGGGDAAGGGGKPMGNLFDQCCDHILLTLKMLETLWPPSMVTYTAKSMIMHLAEVAPRIIHMIVTDCDTKDIPLLQKVLVTFDLAAEVLPKCAAKLNTKWPIDLTAKCQSLLPVIHEREERYESEKKARDLLVIGVDGIGDAATKMVEQTKKGVSWFGKGAKNAAQAVGIPVKGGTKPAA